MGRDSTSLKDDIINVSMSCEKPITDYVTGEGIDNVVWLSRLKMNKEYGAAEGSDTDMCITSAKHRLRITVAENGK